MKVTSNYKRIVEGLIKQLDHCLDQISSVLREDIENESKILGVLNKMLFENQFSPLNSVDNIDSYIKKTFSAQIKVENIVKQPYFLKAKTLEIIQNSAKSNIDWEFVIEKAEGYKNMIEKVVKTHIKQDHDLTELIINGKNYLSSTSDEICPLCLQDINNKELLDDLKDRLKLIQELSEETKELKHLKYSLIQDFELIESIKDDIVKKVRNLNDESNEMGFLLQKAKKLNKFMQNTDLASRFEKSDEIPDLNTFQNEFQDIMRDISDECENILEKIKIPLDKKNELILNTIKLLEKINTYYNELKDLNRDLKINQRKLDISNEIYETFTDVKNEKIQEIYNNIQSVIQKFYTKIHPDDEHTNFKLHIQKRKKASTTIYMDFFDISEQNPLSYWSEGHLDSLGLCIFMAFIKEFTDSPLIVLDDIVTSVDNSHRKKIAELIITEFSKKQIFITTHDEFWFNELKKVQRFNKIENQFENLVIQSWDIESGPLIGKYTTLKEKIKDRLKKREKDVGNLVRKYLEGFLKDLCENFEVPVPYKRIGRYTAGELLVSIKFHIKNLLKKEKKQLHIFDGSLRQVEIWLDTPNRLSHDNELIMDITISEVEDFCKIVFDLEDVFSCPNCKNHLFYDHRYKEIRCRDKKRKCEDPVFLRIR